MELVNILSKQLQGLCVFMRKITSTSNLFVLSSLLVSITRFKETCLLFILFIHHHESWKSLHIFAHAHELDDMTKGKSVFSKMKRQ